MKKKSSYKIDIAIYSQEIHLPPSPSSLLSLIGHWWSSVYQEKKIVQTIPGKRAHTAYGQRALCLRPGKKRYEDWQIRRKNESSLLLGCWVTSTKK